MIRIIKYIGVHSWAPNLWEHPFDVGPGLPHGRAQQSQEKPIRGSWGELLLGGQGLVIARSTATPTIHIIAGSLLSPLTAILE